MNQPSQLSLLTEVQRVQRPYKRQRATARQVYAEVRKVDKAKASRGEETRAGQVLRVLSWHWSATQQSPSAYELFNWARAKGEALFDINTVRPRLTELLGRGLVDVVRDGAGRPVLRLCEHSGKMVCTWVVREAGSREARP
jgi:hypothetical protein